MGTADTRHETEPTGSTPMPNYERARELVLKHGWNTTCFQIVNPGIEYWFGGDGESVVGYVTSGKSRVVAGAPVCSEAGLPAVVEAFESDASANGLGVCYFGAEARLENVLRGSNDHARVLLGAQPVWHPANWARIMAGRASLRAQFNRARNKGVTVSEWSVERAKNNPLLHECLEAWFTLKGLPPLHFVIEPETLGRLENRRIFVAEHDSRVAAFLVLSPIPTRKGWLTEQFPHHPDAPNGTVELMMDTAVGRLCDEGDEYVTLGLSPLSKRAKIEKFDNPVWLRVLLAWMRKHGQRFYNFDGLDSFKAKMTPEYWEPVFAVSNEPEFSGSTLYSIALAFTENHPFRVIAGGLGKAAAAEIRTLRKKIYAGF
ncbi:MAG: phosphatidylglycerol lysyltransferase domain-containing protein [Pyrinomonadaceae bacterium]